MRYPSLVALSFLLSLAGCGVGTLTENLSALNPGGGSSGVSGNFFLHAVNTATLEDITISNPNPMNSITLPAGTWDLRTIAWSSTDLSQNPTCFSDTVSGGVEVSLARTEAACFFSDFSSSTYIQAGVPPTMKSLVIDSCEGLYDPIDATIPAFMGVFNRCVSGFYPPGMLKRAASARITFNNKSLTGDPVAGLSSECLQTNVALGAKIPTKLPLTMTLYEDASCDQEMQSFYFTSGLEGGSTADFDSVLGADSSYKILSLPSGFSRRGTSPFVTEAPGFYCNGSALRSCVFMPPQPINDYILEPGAAHTIKIPGVVSCSPGATTTDDLTFFGCEIKNGDAYLNVLTSSSGGKDFNFSGNTYSVRVGNAAHPEVQANRLYALLKRTVGGRNFGNLDLSLQDDHAFEDVANFGFLGAVMDVLNPGGVGGILWDNICGSSPLASPVTRSYVRDGKTYRIIYDNPPDPTAPRYIVNSSDPLANASAPLFNRRLILSELDTLVADYITTRVVDFACDTNSLGPVYSTSTSDVRIGRSEFLRRTVNGSQETQLRSIVYWNATRLDHARFDVYRLRDVTNASLPLQTDHSFYRVQKVPDGVEENALRVHGMTYRHSRSGAGLNQWLMSYEADLGILGGLQTVTYRPLFSATHLEGNLGDIFSDTRLYGNEKRRPLWGFPEGRIAADGEEFIQALKGSSGELEIRYHLNSGHQLFTPTIAINPTALAVDLSSDGTLAAVAAVAGGELWVYTYDGSNWNEFSETIGTGAAHLEIRVLDDGAIHLGFIATAGVGFYFGYGDVTAGLSSGVLPVSRNSVNVVYHGLDIARTAGNVHYVVSLTDSSTNTNHIEVCSSSILAPGCSLASVESSTVAGDTYLQLSARESSGVLRISSKPTVASYFVELTAPSASLPLSFTRAVINTNSQNFQTYSDTSRFTLDASSPINFPVSSVLIHSVPFTLPTLSSEGLTMSLNDLTPSNFPTIFTDPDTFEDIGN